MRPSTALAWLAYGSLGAPKPAGRERSLKTADDACVWTMGPETQPGKPRS